MRKFLDDKLCGKTYNKYTAEKEYLEKIKDDKDYLNEKKNIGKGSATEKLKNIFNNLEYAVFWNCFTIRI